MRQAAFGANGLCWLRLIEALSRASLLVHPGAMGHGDDGDKARLPRAEALI